MQIHLLAVGTRMPGWVTEGFEEYAKRLPPECRLVLQEIPLAKRGKSGAAERWINEEAERLRAAIPKGARVVALEVKGQAWTTEKLSGRLDTWMGEGRDIALLVGGPDGLEPGLSRDADERWSLSPLTLPHPLVRVILAEQIYRAWTLLRGHPYHR